jgi:hypothetical protein
MSGDFFIFSTALGPRSLRSDKTIRKNRRAQHHESEANWFRPICDDGWKIWCQNFDSAPNHKEAKGQIKVLPTKIKKFCRY